MNEDSFSTMDTISKTIALSILIPFSFSLCAGYHHHHDEDQRKQFVLHVSHFCALACVVVLGYYCCTHSTTTLVYSTALLYAARVIHLGKYADDGEDVFIFGFPNDDDYDSLDSDFLHDYEIMADEKGEDRREYQNWKEAWYGEFRYYNPNLAFSIDCGFAVWNGVLLLCSTIQACISMTLYFGWMLSIYGRREAYSFCMMMRYGYGEFFGFLGWLGNSIGIILFGIYHSELVRCIEIVLLHSLHGILASLCGGWIWVLDHSEFTESWAYNKALHGLFWMQATLHNALLWMSHGIHVHQRFDSATDPVVFPSLRQPQSSIHEETYLQSPTSTPVPAIRETDPYAYSNKDLLIHASLLPPRTAMRPRRHSTAASLQDTTNTFLPQPTGQKPHVRHHDVSSVADRRSRITPSPPPVNNATALASPEPVKQLIVDHHHPRSCITPSQPPLNNATALASPEPIKQPIVQTHRSSCITPPLVSPEQQQRDFVTWMEKEVGYSSSHKKRRLQSGGRYY